MFSGYVKDIESKPSPTPWGSKMPFANMLAEFSNSVHVSLTFDFQTFLHNVEIQEFSYYLKFFVKTILVGFQSQKWSIWQF